jgi:splicing factor 3A subunit 2
LTLHTNEGSYLAHTQGKKHQANLARRAAREARDGNTTGSGPTPAANKAAAPKKQFVKIGRPGYQVIKVRDPNTRQHGFLFRIEYPQIVASIVPRHRFMGAYEQRVEQPDRNFQYVVIAAEPYETIAFKIPAHEVDMGEGKFFTFWDPDTKQYALQLLFRTGH